MGTTRAMMLILVGHFASEVFEPAMIIPEASQTLLAEDIKTISYEDAINTVDFEALSPLAQWAAPIYGLGQGRGIAVLISLIGAITIVLGLIALFLKPLRKIDTMMPDSEDLPESDDDTYNSEDQHLAAAS